MLEDPLNTPGTEAVQNYFGGVEVFGGLDSAAKLRLPMQFRSLEGAVGFSRLANGFEVLNAFLGGPNWGSPNQA